MEGITLIVPEYVLSQIYSWICILLLDKVVLEVPNLEMHI